MLSPELLNIARKWVLGVISTWIVLAGNTSKADYKKIRQVLHGWRSERHTGERVVHAWNVGYSLENAKYAEDKKKLLATITWLRRPMYASKTICGVVS